MNGSLSDLEEELDRLIRAVNNLNTRADSYRYQDMIDRMEDRVRVLSEEINWRVMTTGPEIGGA